MNMWANVFFHRKGDLNSAEKMMVLPIQDWDLERTYCSETCCRRFGLRPSRFLRTKFDDDDDGDLIHKMLVLLI